MASAPPRNPITGIVACCARAASGHTVAPPMSVMNSRRLMGVPSQASGRTLPHLLRTNAAVHRSKDSALMSQMGHSHRSDGQ